MAGFHGNHLNKIRLLQNQKQGGLQQISKNSDISGTKRLFINSDTSCERTYLTLSYNVTIMMFTSEFDRI